MNRKQLVLVGTDGAVIETITGFLTLAHARELLASCGYLRANRPQGTIYWGFIPV